MKLPLLISVPHAGLWVPPEAEAYCVLSREEIVRDGDEGAARIYAIHDEVAQFVTTEVARAIVDMNRSEDDRRADGVVKTHTCWQVPVYREVLAEEVVQSLLARYHRPYHAQLRSLAGAGVRLGLDCHTMAAEGPPIAPDPGQPRPLVCLGDGHGACPRDWVEAMRDCFARHMPGEVTINRPFSGGHITRTHGAYMPWMQIEMSRTAEVEAEVKRGALLAALRDWCALDLSDQ